MANIGTILSILGAIGALLALGFALKQFRDARTTLGELKTATKGLEGVSRRLAAVQEEISTHSIGTFPDFMDEIVDVLTKAGKEIWICCDLLGYGMVSCPDIFRDSYLTCIQVQSVNIPIHIVVAHDDTLQSVLRAQFNQEDWEAYRLENDRGVQSVLNDYWHGDGDVDLSSCDAFVEVLTEAQTTIERMLDPETRKIDVTNTTSIVPVLFWIADGTDAVLALTRYTSEAREVGFRTSDRGLIQALIGIFDRYKGHHPGVGV